MSIEKKFWLENWFQEIFWFEQLLYNKVDFGASDFEAAVLLQIEVKPKMLGRSVTFEPKSVEKRFNSKTFLNWRPLMHICSPKCISIALHYRGLWQFQQIRLISGNHENYHTISTAIRDGQVCNWIQALPICRPSSFHKWIVTQEKWQPFCNWTKVHPIIAEHRFLALSPYQFLLFNGFYRASLNLPLETNNIKMWKWLKLLLHVVCW